MRVDLRVKHDIEARKAAIGLFERGHGFESAAKALSVPRNTVRQWLYVYRSFGSEVLLSMDGMFVSSSGFQLRQRFFSHVARKGFRFGKGVPLSLFGFAS